MSCSTCAARAGGVTLAAMAEETDHSIKVVGPEGQVRVIHRNALERFVAAGYKESGSTSGKSSASASTPKEES